LDKQKLFIGNLHRCFETAGPSLWNSLPEFQLILGKRTSAMNIEQFTGLLIVWALRSRHIKTILFKLRFFKFSYLLTYL